MVGWIERFSTRKSKSADKAKERLKLVLINDRTDLSLKDMEDLKNDLLDVISNYVDIEPAEVRISMTHDGRRQRLVANIPLRAITRQRLVQFDL